MKRGRRLKLGNRRTMGDLTRILSSTASLHQRLVIRRIQAFLSIFKLVITVLLVLNPMMMMRELLCEATRQHFNSNSSRSRIEIVQLVIEVRCCIVFIHYASDISDVVTAPTIDGQFQGISEKVFGSLIPKLVKRYRNRIFLFLLVMEENSKEKLHDEMMVTRPLRPLKNATEGFDANGRRRPISTKEESWQVYFSMQYIGHRKSESLLKLWKPPWKRRRFRANGTPFLLYGDVLRIVEDWQFQVLFISRESIYWVQNRSTYLDPIWELANVIQHKKLCTILSVLRLATYILQFYMGV